MSSRIEHIKSELKWLTEQLGPARDLDVFLKEGVKPLELEEPAAREVTTLAEDLDRRRRASFVQAKGAIQSERYRKLVLECALWLAGGDWFTSRDPLIVARRDVLVSDFAAEELARRTRKISSGRRSSRGLNPPAP